MHRFAYVFISHAVVNLPTQLLGQPHTDQSTLEQSARSRSQSTELFKRDTVADVRVLGRVRLSRATEESTSAERQREEITAWADRNDHTVIGWAEDLDVSGGIDPFDTPGLGPWLRDRHHEWDILAAWKLDRVSRRAIPMGKMFGWLLDNDKTLVCTSDSIDLSTPMGRLIAYVIVTIAEGELEAIRDRNRASQRKLRELGRWGGGKPIYGYEPRPRPDGGWGLVPDPHSSAVLLRIIEKTLNGQSLTAIADELTASGELTPNDYIRKRAGKEPTGHAWTGNNISRILRSPSLLGYATHGGVTVRDDDGMPIAKGPALITRSVYDQLQETLDQRSVVSSTRTRKTSPLLGVLTCAVCGKHMHHRRVSGQYRYYLCRNGHDVNSMRAELVEEAVEDTFMHHLGDRQVKQRVFVPAEDHEIELAEAQRAVEEISTLLGTMSSDTVRTRLTKQLTALDGRIRELEQLPVREAGWDYRETGETYRDAWVAADTDGRRQLLLRSGITVAAAVRGKTRTTGGAWEFRFNVPDEVLP